MRGKPRMIHRLGVRLALALTLALLPLGILAGLQVQSLRNEARARSEASILGETLIAVAPEAGLIRGARAAVAAIAVPIALFGPDQQLCSDLLKNLVEQSSTPYSYAAFVPLSGQVVCSSSDKPLDLSDSPRLAAMRADPKPDIAVIRNGRVSGTSVLVVGHPVVGQNGALLGYASISMPHSALRRASPGGWAARQMGSDAPVTLVTFDAEGNILTASMGLDDAPRDLPADRQLVDLATNDLATFSAASRSGEMRIYAVAPMLDGELFTIGSWPAEPAPGSMALLFSPYVPPILMWLASLLVALISADRLVTRHIRVLRRSITSFSKGSRLVGNLNLHGAPIEICDVADAYLTMTDTILRDEAHLEDMVHQREALLREVHHRVKNNLQLISSIMNMQMRQSRNPETRGLMKNLQDRVMSLATIHRELYQTSGLTDVRADELLDQIVRQVLNLASGPSRRFNVTTAFDQLRLTPDQAVPLALMLTEALTNAVKYAGKPDCSTPDIEITLRRQGSTRALLQLTNSVVTAPPAQTDGSDGLGMQLLVAFAQQLGGTVETTVTPDSHRLSMAFEVQPLMEAEAAAATN